MLSRGSGCRDRQIPSERTGKNHSIYSVLLMSQQTTASLLLRRCFPCRETPALLPVQVRIAHEHLLAGAAFLPRAVLSLPFFFQRPHEGSSEEKRLENEVDRRGDVYCDRHRGQEQREQDADSIEHDPVSPPVLYAPEFRVCKAVGEDFRTPDNSDISRGNRIESLHIHKWRSVFSAPSGLLPAPLPGSRRSPEPERASA